MSSQLNKRNRFEKVAEKRVQFILDKLELLGNCSNRSNYDYTEDDVKKMFSVMKEKMKQVEVRFHDELSKQDKSKFKF
jgi:hypothetical protein